MSHRLSRRALKSAFLLLLSACASAGPPKTIAVAPGSGIMTGSEEQRRALATADSAARAFAPADVDFMQGMIPHHAQAVKMARWAKLNGARSDLRILCGRIDIAQTDEIRMMRRWLAERRQDVPDSTAMRHVMKMANGATHEVMMPGMLSDAEMAALEKARGSQFDRLFLTGMIRHHRGAIDMVNELFNHGNAGHDDTVFRFAADVVSDQTAEIQVMLRMLDTVP